MNNHLDNQKIDLAHKDDFLAIQRLSMTSFKGPHLLEAHWNWRYFNNPVAEVRIYVCRDPKDEIIGLRALSVFSFFINGKGAQLHLGTGGIVHPNHRRKGIFSKLVNYSDADTAERSNNYFIYCFPNDQSVRALSNIESYYFINEMTLWVRPVKLLRSFYRFIRGKKCVDYYDIQANIPDIPDIVVDNSLCLKQITSFDNVVLNIDQFAEVNKSIMLYRDSAYLNWRYRDNPLRKYEIHLAKRGETAVGYIIFERVRLYGLNACLIVDLLGANAKIVRHLIKRAIESSKITDVDIMGFLIGRFNPYAKVFNHLGFWALPHKLTPKNFFMMGSPKSPAHNNSLAQEIEKTLWYVTWGDNDIV